MIGVWPAHAQRIASVLRKCMYRVIVGDTHASKLQFSTIKRLYLEIVSCSRNIRYIITKIYMLKLGQLCLI